MDRKKTVYVIVKTLRSTFVHKEARFCPSPRLQILLNARDLYDGRAALLLNDSQSGTSSCKIPAVQFSYDTRHQDMKASPTYFSPQIQNTRVAILLRKHNIFKFKPCRWPRNAFKTRRPVPAVRTSSAPTEY